MATYGIISDTHIDINSKSEDLITQLQEVFDGVEKIYHAGDIIDKEFLDSLKKIAPVKVVKGEDDKIEGLSTFLKFEVRRYKIGMIHKIPKDQSDLEDFCRKNDLIDGILIYGHTHQPLIQGTSFNTLLLNPGSPTQPKAPEKIKGFNEPKARPSCILLTIKNGIITTILVNLNKAL